MSAIVIAALGATWLGILSSVSPCPLAVNVAAISYLLRGGRTGRAFAESAALYILGRSLIMALVGFLVVRGIFAVPELAMILQKSMNRFLGPLFVVVGVFVLDLVPVRFPWTKKAGKVRFGADRGGSFLMGVVFGLAPCPVTAALFFGALVPMAVEHASPVLLPLLFGAGTALPVALAAGLAFFGVSVLAKALLSFATLDRWLTLANGAIFISLGLSYILTFVFPIL